jgi:hypothetical protein
VAHFYSSTSVGGLNLSCFEDEWKKRQASNVLKALCHKDRKVAAVARCSYRNSVNRLRSFVKGAEIELRAGEQLDAFGVVDPKVWMSLLRTVRHHQPRAKVSDAWLEANSIMEAAQWQLFSSAEPNRPPVLRDLNKDAPIRHNKITRHMNAMFRERQHECWRGLELQGECLRRLRSDASRGDALSESFTWLRKPWLLSDQQFGWQIKCFLNLIPCRWNLHQWKKKPDKVCQFCRLSAETPMHALNGCKSQLRYSMYKRRHDAIQDVVADACTDAGFTLTVDQCVRSQLCSHSFRPDIVKYDDAAQEAVMVDAKSPFLGRSFDSVDPKNKQKYGFYVPRLRSKGWSNSVHTLMCSSSGVIPKCTKDALVALGLPRTVIKPCLEKINIACIKAGYCIRKSLGVDRRVRDRVYHRRRPSS